MNKKMKFFVLLLLSHVYNLDATVGYHAGIPGANISWQNEDVTYAFDYMNENKIWSLLAAISFVGAGYLTQDYWLTPMIKLMKKNECPCLQMHKKDFQQNNQGGGNNKDTMLSDFQKCRARIYRAGEIKDTFDSVAGNEGAKADLQEIKAFLKDPKQFTDMGAKPIKGILLEGEPGCGKTILARALAGEVNCPFITICASEFIEAIVGIGAARMRDLFAKAKELAPCIIFIDEIDAVGKKRAGVSFGGGGDEQAQTIAQLLSLMDGFDVAKHPIVVMAATNRVDVLDSALLRPGRFDRIVKIEKPYKDNRKKILEIHLKNVKKTDDLDLELIARATMGFSGADLARLVNDAAILAVIANSSCVEMKHFDWAYDNMTLGRETKGMEYNQEEVWVTAIHEAGHSIARLFVQNADPLYKVTITPRGGALGISYSRPLREKYSSTESQMRALIVICLSGGLAEQEFGFDKSGGLSSDLSKARQIAYNMVVRYGMSDALRYLSYDEIDHRLPNDIATQIHHEVQKIVDECYVVAKNLVAERRDYINQLALLLMDQGTVFGNEVYQMCGLQEPALDYGLDSQAGA